MDIMIESAFRWRNYPSGTLGEHRDWRSISLNRGRVGLVEPPDNVVPPLEKTRISHDATADAGRVRLGGIMTGLACVPSQKSRPSRAAVASKNWVQALR
jgi:hypothetical protein